MANLNVVALAGGVGGAKLCDGLAQILPPECLTIIVNTGDDFTYLGLRISPDLDTVCYTLAGLANPETGWGRINESWNVLETIKQMGMPAWFQIGDSDLATHLLRTIRYSEGVKLNQITRELCKLWDVKVRVLPMSDDVVQTRIFSDVGDLAFQDYFVQRKCAPVVKRIYFYGVDLSKPAPSVIDSIKNCDAVIICPSNPWVSIDPILAVPNIKKELGSKIVIAVSPIIGDNTVKGPAAKMFSEMGLQPSALAVANHYKGLIHSIIIDNSDINQAEEINELGIHTSITNILMKDKADRGRLAIEIIDYINVVLRGR
jgi:LPPG:FO 2-phospho-L-lactate transferase